MRPSPIHQRQYRRARRFHPPSRWPAAAGSRKFFKIFAFGCESFVFVYMGLALFTYNCPVPYAHIEGGKEYSVIMITLVAVVRPARCPAAPLPRCPACTLSAATVLRCASSGSQLPFSFGVPREECLHPGC